MKSSFKIQKLKCFNFKVSLPVSPKSLNTGDRTIGSGIKQNSINWFMISFQDWVLCIKPISAITTSDPTIYFIVLWTNVMWLETFHMRQKAQQWEIYVTTEPAKITFHQKLTQMSNLTSEKQMSIPWELPYYVLSTFVTQLMFNNHLSLEIGTKQLQVTRWLQKW